MSVIHSILANFGSKSGLKRLNQQASSQNNVKITKIWANYNFEVIIIFIFRHFKVFKHQRLKQRKLFSVKLFVWVSGLARQIGWIIRFNEILFSSIFLLWCIIVMLPLFIRNQDLLCGTLKVSEQCSRDKVTW